jgi:hypothetical protein
MKNILKAFAKGAAQTLGSVVMIIILKTAAEKVKEFFLDED